MKKRVIIPVIFLILISIVTAKTLIAADSEAKLYFAVGKHYFENNDFESSITFFEKSVELDRSFAEAYHNLGVSYYQTKDFANSIKNLERSVQINQKYAKAYYNLGLLYFELNNFENAIKNFESAALLEGTQNQHFDLAQSFVALFRQKEDLGKITSDDLDLLRSAISNLELSLDVENAKSNLEIITGVLKDYS